VRCFIKFVHIDGHQDKTNKVLNIDEKLNVEADSLATKGLGVQQIKHIMLPGNQGELYIKGKQVTSHYTKELRNAYHSVQMHYYLKDKYGWSDKTIANIWWQVHGKALNVLKEGNRRTISKFLHNRLPCNKRENIYYPYRSQYCSQCKHSIECNDHILRCITCVYRTKLRS
jgi:hypothetical protein